MPSRPSLLVFLLLFGVAAGPKFCVAQAAQVQGGTTTMQLTTTAFQPDGMIPDQYTCKGTNMSPDFAWTGAPAGTQSFALLAEDPDAPKGTHTHWIVYNIPPDKKDLIANMPAQNETEHGVRQGKNDFGKTGYGGPCPPAGDKPHRYVFTLYALDQPPELASGASKEAFKDAIKQHVLATAQVTGKFGVKQ